ncbi:four helix bundle protein [Thermodesulfovibrionales bacterium]|nr:four helix bundle protein [Thermodesulfovibrionales bacterium]
MSDKIRNVRDLEVYKLAFETAMEIFQITKIFPQDQKYEHILAMLNNMEMKANSFCFTTSKITK